MLVGLRYEDVSVACCECVAMLYGTLHDGAPPHGRSPHVGYGAAFQGANLNCERIDVHPMISSILPLLRRVYHCSSFLQLHFCSLQSPLGCALSLSLSLSLSRSVGTARCLITLLGARAKTAPTASLLMLC
jgi:hypothetical protein